MRKGKVVPFVIVGMMAGALLAIILGYFGEWFPQLNQKNVPVIVGMFGSVLGVSLIIVLLVNGRRQKLKIILTEVQREIDRQLRLIDRNRRGSLGQRKALVNEVFGFVEELNQFISVGTYQRTRRGLLEARQEFKELNIPHQVKHRQSTKHKREDQANFLRIEAELTELTLKKLAEMKVVGSPLEWTDQKGRDELRFLLDEKSAYFGQEYQGLSPYFGSITTFLVYLNHQLKEGNLRPQEYHHQIEVLRHHFTRNDLLVILLYVLLIPSGCQLGVELVGTSFFGDLAEVGQNTFLEAPELFRVYLEEVFAKSFNNRTNKNKQEMTRYFYQAHRQELAKGYRNRKTAINRVLSGEYYVKNENGQTFLKLTDKLSLGS